MAPFSAFCTPFLVSSSLSNNIRLDISSPSSRNGDTRDKSFGNGRRQKREVTAQGGKFASENIFVQGCHLLKLDQSKGKRGNTDENMCVHKRQVPINRLMGSKRGTKRCHVDMSDLAAAAGLGANKSNRRRASSLAILKQC